MTQIAINSIHVAINVNGNLDVVIDNLNDINGNLDIVNCKVGAMKKTAICCCLKQTVL